VVLSLLELVEVVVQVLKETLLDIVVLKVVPQLQTDKDILKFNMDQVVMVDLVNVSVVEAAAVELAATVVRHMVVVLVMVEVVVDLVDLLVEILDTKVVREEMKEILVG
tara:strand:- start:271 stop:597 length:327 start_codon:yes stop_codon:yes gene_type:complete